MLLSGTLEELTLPDLLDLISRSSRSGVLRVGDGAMMGRVFFAEGAVTFATTRWKPESGGSGPDRRKAAIEDVLRADAEPEKLGEFLQEQVKEVLARLLRLEEGSFEFEEGATAPYDTGQRLDPADLLEQAQRRMGKWREIEEVIPSPRTLLRMASRAPDGSDGKVVVDELGWRLLAALGRGSDPREVARRAGMWQFPAANKLAQLVREGLVEVIEAAEAVTSPPEHQPQSEPEIEEQPRPADDDAAGEEEDEQGSPLMQRWKELRQGGALR